MKEEKVILEISSFFNRKCFQDVKCCCESTPQTLRKGQQDKTLDKTSSCDIKKTGKSDILLPAEESATVPGFLLVQRAH